tara:strand:- start:928 stop:1200 length:273 start_codon:yes stop_codon:yes gene_type:complete
MKKNFSLKSLVFIFFFSLFFIVPHFVQFFNQGIFISGDYFYNQGNFIENLSSLNNYILNNYVKSLNVIKNPIFIFFIVGAIFQKIIKEIQ